MHCPKCNRLHTSTVRATLHIQCECGEALQLIYYAQEPLEDAQRDTDLKAYWGLLHLMQYQFIEMDKKLAEWLNKIPCAVCKENFKPIITEHPPVLTSKEGFFAWTVLVHNLVNKKLNKPTMPLEEARLAWSEPRPVTYCRHMGSKLREASCNCGGIFTCSKKGECTQSKPDSELVQLCGTCDVPDKMATLVGGPTTKLLTTKPRIDVVIPYYKDDVQWVHEALATTQLSRGVETVIHLIADGIESRFTSRGNIRAYQTEKNVGPYVITNSIDFETDYIAILDADDLMRPERLIESVSTLLEYEADMVGGAMIHFSDDPSLADRVGKTTKPFNVYPRVPHGAMVNSAKMFTTRLFNELNGFADWPYNADHEWDSRVALAGKRMFHTMTIWGDRRLHSSSLSIGKFPPNSPARIEKADLIQAWAREIQAGTKTIRSCGALDKRIILRKL